VPSCEPLDELGEFLEKFLDGFEGTTSAFQSFGGKAGEGAAEGSNP